MAYLEHLVFGIFMWGCSETTKGGFLPIRRKMWVAPILMHWSPNGAYSAFRHMAPYLHMFNLAIYIYYDEVSVSVSRNMSTFSLSVRARFDFSMDPPVSDEKVSVCHDLPSLP